MRALLLFVLVAVVIVGGLKVAGVPVPFLDYSVGPIGGDRGPGMPNIQLDAPGFDEFDAP